MVSAVMAGTVGPALRHAPLTQQTLRLLFLGDYAAAPIRPLRSTTLRRVRLDGFQAELVTAPGARERSGLILHFHGGAFVAGGLRSHRRLVSRISQTSRTPVLQVAYRQLPLVKLDETVEDCLAAYRWALSNGYDAAEITLSGDSAGGYLALSLTLRAREEGLPLPAAIVALSPWLDLLCADSAGHPNALVDPYMPIRHLAKIGTWVTTEASATQQPLTANLHSLPPVLIQVGSTELLLSDAHLLAQRLADANVKHRLQIWEHQMHVFQAAADLIPEARAALAEVGDFISTHNAPSGDRVA